MCSVESDREGGKVRPAYCCTDIHIYTYMLSSRVSVIRALLVLTFHHRFSARAKLAL